MQKEKRTILINRNSNSSAMKQYYKAYCKVLVNVIREAKRMTLNTRILKSNNKTKTTCSIVNEFLGKQHYTQGIQEINIEGKRLTTQQDIANAFNTYFSTIIDKTNMDSQTNIRHGNPHTYCYLDQDVGASYPPLVFKTFSTQEILAIIRSIQISS
jgi:hypothetical protein